MKLSASTSRSKNIGEFIDFESERVLPYVGLALEIAKSIYTKVACRIPGSLE